MSKNNISQKNNKSNTDNSQEKPVKKSFGRKLLSFIGCFFVWLLSTLVVLLIGLYILLMYVNKGPSPHLSELFVSSAMESSVGGVMAKLFYTDEEIEEIRQHNIITVTDEITDTTLISVMSVSDQTIYENTDVIETVINENDPDGDGIEIHDIHGATYQGKMMIVYDPSRVKVGVINQFDLDTPGMLLENLVAKYDAVAGINGGKYDDEIGFGTGGMPEGIVVSNGNLLLGDLDTVYDVYGFTKDNVLVVGSMTASHAMNIGIRDAVSFGPALITNGKSAGYTGIGSGLNPRTAIGQRTDGAVLLLCIEGRQADSLGASMSDLIEVMLDYGAVNAANLDGGMSSSMYYNGESIVESCTLGYDRRIPTAFIVERMGE